MQYIINLEKMNARILIKYSSSKCNKSLLDFMHSNINSIKNHADVKIIIVYEDLYDRLEGKVNKLPVLILDGRLITGNGNIKQSLMDIVKSGTTAHTSTGTNGNNSIDLQEYWNAEMHSNMDDNCDEDDPMEKVKIEALSQTMSHNEQMTKRPKKKRDTTNEERHDNIQIGGISTNKISDMVSDDPIMQKFWENQEETPGMSTHDF